MGKEIKIGLAAIVALLLVLGVVVYWRMGGSERRPSPLAEIAREKEKEAGEHHKGMPGDPSKAGRPTVVAASAGPMSRPAPDSTKWLAPPGGLSQPRSVPPSYMPNPSQAPGDRTPPPGYAFAATQDGRPGGGPSHGLSDPLHRSLPGSGQPGSASASIGPGQVPPAPMPNDAPTYGAYAPQNPLRNGPHGSAPSGNAAPSGQSIVNRFAVAGSSDPGSTQPPPYGTSPRYSYGNSYDAAGSGHHPPPPGMMPPGTLASARRSPESYRREDGTYKVEPNDSFWVISDKLYGTGAYFKALAEHNRDQVSGEEHLQVGTILSAPAVGELEKRYPDLCPKPAHRRSSAVRTASASTPVQRGGRRVYVVEEGDTLYDIARYELGKASRWAEIWELNRERIGDDQDYLAPGTQLALPDGEPADATTRRPVPSYRR